MIARDPFTLWWDQRFPDVPARVYQPAGFLGGPVLGWQIRIGSTRFVYRIPEEAPGIFYIVLIERGQSRSGLQSPFGDMVRLLRRVQESAVGITWIRGHVEPTAKRPADALTRERILAFYQLYLTAVSTGIENGVEWYGGDLTAFSWTHEKRRVNERRDDAHAGKGVKP